jgi:hypothetical protein
LKKQNPWKNCGVKKNLIEECYKDLNLPSGKQIPDVDFSVSVNKIHQSSISLSIKAKLNLEKVLTLNVKITEVKAPLDVM